MSQTSVLLMAGNSIDVTTKSGEVNTYSRNARWYRFVRYAIKQT